MADLSYLVEIELKTKGDAGKALNGIDAKANKTSGVLSKLGKDFSNLGYVASGAFDSIGNKILSASASAAKLGIAAGIGAAAYGVFKLNAGLETTKTSFAAVFSAQGVTKDVDSGLERASQILETMKKDAADLPGEFEDLVGIFQSGIGSGLNAGLTPESFEKLSANAMAAGKALSVPLDQAGRELALLLEGRAGSQNVFGTRLGIKAEGFNDKTSEERVKIIQERINKFEPAIRAFGKTFDAAMSTSISNAKEFGAMATAPLFERAKETLNEINAWFDANKGEVARWANDIGIFLREAFDKGKGFIKEWGPPFMKFSTNVYNKIVEIVRVLQPLFDKIGQMGKNFLNDDKSIDKLLMLGGLFAGNKLLGGIGSLGAKGGALAGAAGTGKNALMGGVAGYVIGDQIASAIATKLTGDSEAGKIFGGIFGGMGAGAAAGGAIGGPVGAIVGGAIGGGAGAYSEYSRVQEESAAKMHQANEQLLDAVAAFSGEWDPVAQKLVNTTGKIDLAGEAYQYQLKRITELYGEMEGDLFSFQAAVRNADADMKERFKQDAADLGNEAAKNLGLTIGTAALAATDPNKKKSEDKKKNTLAGSGNMNIQKVEITVSSNQAPDQIAFAVYDQLANIKKYPGSSRRAKNYSKIGY